MAPFDSSSADGGAFRFPSGVRSLTLEFSRAADYARIDHVFDPAVKHSYDPHDYVYKRREEDFRRAVAEGGGCTLSNTNGDVAGMTVAYHTYKDEHPAPGAPYEYTEMGTTLSRIPGYNSAQLIVAALAIHEWWQAAPSRMMVTIIDNTNEPSVRTYRDSLQWEEVTDAQETESLFTACYRNIAEDHGGGPGKPPPPEDRTGESFYAFTDQALAVHARILLEFMDQGGLLNRRTGDFIPVDFHALDDEGLTRGRIEALARGTTDRGLLFQIQ